MKIDEFEVLVRRIDVEEYKEDGTEKIRNITGDVLEPGEDGFLGEAVIPRGGDRPADLNFPDKFLLEVSYDRTAPVFCCTTQAENLRLCSDRNQRRDHGAEERSGSTEPIFALIGDRACNTIRVARRWHKAYTRQHVQAQLFSQEPPDTEFYVVPKYPGNSLKVFVLKDGRLVLWEAGIISQFGRFFLTTQKTFEATVGLTKGKLFINRVYGSEVLAKNQDLKELLEDVHRDEPDVFALKEFASVPRAALLTPLAVEKGDGVVEWFNEALGMGAVRLVDGRTGSVQWPDIEDSPCSPFSGRRVGLRSGQHVTIGERFTPAEDRKTEFKFFLMGIKPID
ncbi:hypothetical protein KJ969_02410 [Patescibacteria group bacterium]|nr:hypothetical protein [Patescibacteria group bacterium]MBU1921883.1 hypothetical protein [Patescibacteria group bacterium]